MRLLLSVLVDVTVLYRQTVVGFILTDGFFKGCNLVFGCSYTSYGCFNVQRVLDYGLRIGLTAVVSGLSCVLYVVQLVAKCGKLLRMAVDIGLGGLYPCRYLVNVLLLLPIALGVLSHFNGNLNGASSGYPVTAFANIRSERR